jgi:tetratricopeptide (TPR) repeat protein
VAWGAYVVLLVPVMGVVHAGVQATADRYSYLPSMGLALVIGAGLGAATRALQTGRLRVSLARLGLVAAAAWILSLGVLTWRQTGVWRDNATLWTHAVGASPGCALCRTNLGVELLARGQAGAALGQFERALATRPESTKAHGNLGRALAALGRHGEAVPHYERMLQRYPGHIDVRVRLAQSLVALRRLPEAVEQVRVAVHVVPAAEAIDDFQRRVAADPGAVVARLGLAVALRAAGRIEDARAAHEALRAADPELAAEAGPGFDQILAAGQPAP